MRSANSLGVVFSTVEGRLRMSFFSGVAPKCSITEVSTTIANRGSASEKHSGEYSKVMPSPPSSRISASMRRSSISRTAISTMPLRVVLYTHFWNIGEMLVYRCMMTCLAPSTASNVLRMRCSRACVST